MAKKSKAVKKSAAKAPETKTLLELIEQLTAESPGIDDEIAELLRKYPDMVGPDVKDPLQKRYRTNFLLGRIAAAFTLNFLCRAYGRPDLGYKPSGVRPTQN
jgi:hypothetical protein